MSSSPDLPTAAHAMVELRCVTFGYGRQAVFSAFSWSLQRGEIWSVIGPSACGKSTLLLLLAGLLHPQEGYVTIDGARLTRPRPETGLILQAYELLPWATVRQNVALGLRIRTFYGPDGRHVPVGSRLDEGEVRARSEQWMARLDISRVAERYPRQISGGQQQRTAIARTLVLQPDLLLMDEPFSALDAPTREDLQGLMLQLAQEFGLTVVLVTHSVEEAAFVGQKALVLGQTPNGAARVLDLPHTVRSDYRASSDYQQACVELRTALGGKGERT